MIFQFPIPHDDELLVSILARFIARQGLREDKAALSLLFGSRNIVLSPLLQGHLSDLYRSVGRLWPITPNEILEKHSTLPLFKSFVEPDRYAAICSDLAFDSKSHSMLKAGINASSLVFPACYRYCPICFSEDINQFAYSYWRRQFQLPGVCVCLQHHCMLMDSHFDLKPSRRHRFIEASSLSDMSIPSAAEVCEKLILVDMARNIDQLLHQSFPYISPDQWTVFYDARLREVGLKSARGVEHHQVENQLIQYWEKNFLAECGLDLVGGVTWLQTFFRKHRKHFSYLHHLLCLQALFPNWKLNDVFSVASSIRGQSTKRVYSSSQADLRAPEYRAVWHDLKKENASLKDIRATREGARVYSWLYRFDNVWLKENLPAPIKNNLGRVVDWKKRDLEVVRALLKIRSNSFDELSLPRMSQQWFITQTKLRWGVDKHLSKLPLCRRFFIKYTESVEEFQVPRVLAIIVNAINFNEPIPKIYEIERLAGLSKKRIRNAARRIIREDFSMVSSPKLSAKKYRAY
ncbi:TnsD family Tn7-like transposition protein [Marinomonas sp. TI.3.20]|uniref:TnsD family Tn7-like transposition protein n=1 Tax=Marinomonas sp. TI.3.20 TaxID=3121296 RepID=UPI00311F1218